MSALQHSARHLIRLLAENNEYTPAVNSAVVAVWDAAWADNDDDENLVALAEKMADTATGYYLYDGTVEELDLAVRCFTYADYYLTIDQGSNSATLA
ncbi:MAG: hypothetical protein JWR34_1796 [Mycobacterium sp.]|nr:hypothetical protein [Mycobacterium sp.]